MSNPFLRADQQQNTSCNNDTSTHNEVDNNGDDIDDGQEWQNITYEETEEDRKPTSVSSFYRRLKLGCSSNGLGLAITSQTYSGHPPSTDSEKMTTASPTNAHSIVDSKSKTKPYKGINPQLGSLLLNGRIPAEIRNQIFREALTEYPNTAKRYDTNSHHSRPEHSCRCLIATNLLLTCKLVYHEASHLPISINDHRIWYGELLMSKDLTSYIGKMTPKQRLLIKRLKIYMNQFMLETTWARSLMYYGINNIKSITITIRRGGWRRWESDFPLAIDPRRGPISNLEMSNLWQRLGREKKSMIDDGKPVGFKTRSWGLEFRRFKHLEEIIIEFETAEYQTDQLEEIVKYSQDWVFPTHHSMKSKVFKAEDRVDRQTWMGPKCFVAKARWRYDNGDVREEEPVVLLRKRWKIVDGDPPTHEA